MFNFESSCMKSCQQAPIGRGMQYNPQFRALLQPSVSDSPVAVATGFLRCAVRVQQAVPLLRNHGNATVNCTTNSWYNATLNCTSSFALLIYFQSAIRAMIQFKQLVTEFGNRPSPDVRVTRAKFCVGPCVPFGRGLKRGLGAGLIEIRPSFYICWSSFRSTKTHYSFD